MSSGDGAQETRASPGVLPPNADMGSGTRDAAGQIQKEDRGWTTQLSEQNGSRDTDAEDEDQEFSTSLSVGDGHYLVDLGSSAEFIVDEECILQLFRSCRKCNRPCTVGKRVTGLKLVVHQACCFCNSHREWTNLLEGDND